ALLLVRSFGFSRGRERIIATFALALVVIYCGVLALAHREALNSAKWIANRTASQMNERVLRVAAMPTLANPSRWFCVLETDRAFYRFSVGLGAGSASDPPQVVDGYQTDAPEAIERYEKPNERAAQLLAVAEQDRRAGILLDFARFPIAHVPDEDCITQTIVQFADLRYTKPGAGRATFSLNVPIECASK
ncbi:MAG TPA: hypothetical protein VGQ72_10650, partial [Pyrinomonadaceae bacterium]|nr:hypothetical protein [Pyrinomonadaceae bacterium]